MSRDEVYDDSVNVRLLPGQLRHRATNWDDVSLSKAGFAIIRRIATASRRSGSWRGRRGVAVVLAALDAGAPKKILKLLRGVINPLRRLAQILRETEEYNADGLHRKASSPVSPWRAGYRRVKDERRRTGCIWETVHSCNAGIAISTPTNALYPIRFSLFQLL